MCPILVWISTFGLLVELALVRTKNEPKMLRVTQVITFESLFFINSTPLECFKVILYGALEASVERVYNNSVAY